VATARLTLAASDATSALLARVMASVRPEGNVLAPGALKSVADNDLLPGIVLFNLATFQRATGRELAIDWVACREWCLRRARLVASWGLAAWHAQVWSVVAEITGDDAFHAASIELALWMAARQLEADGSYLTDLSPWGAGFHTAFAAEGVSAGWHSARALRDDLTAKALEDSWNAAMRYCDQLVFRREDTFWCSDRVRVLGGVRSNAASSALRVDFTSHTLQALLGGLQL